MITTAPMWFNAFVFLFICVVWMCQLSHIVSFFVCVWIYDLFSNACVDSREYMESLTIRSFLISPNVHLLAVEKVLKLFFPLDSIAGTIFLLWLRWLCEINQVFQILASSSKTIMYNIWPTQCMYYERLHLESFTHKHKQITHQTKNL